MQNYRTLLEQVREGKLSVDEGLALLRQLDTEDLGFAKIDHHRALRKGFPEVVYCEGKSVDHATEILRRLSRDSSQSVLGTRASQALYKRILEDVPEFEYHEDFRLLVLRRNEKVPAGHVLVVCAGTSDIPVAEEAAITAEVMGAHVETLFDVGVAGLHRLLSQVERLYAAKVLVVVAGMEGALVSVIAGLVDKPVIAVPTSVGYGTHFAGVTPLLSMLNACATGVAVVNIDNGFGAGYLAAMINQMGE